MDLTQERPGPRIARDAEPEITFADYPRIAPGEYQAVSKRARVYFDKSFRRHVCCVWFSILNDAGTVVIAKLPWFLNLSDGPQPWAGRRSNYWQAWIKANGGRSPLRRDRLTPRVFEQRAARVLVADTKMNFRGDKVFAPYSVIREVIRWETR